MTDQQPDTPRGEQGEDEPQHRPRIYVASLSDYNAGVLHGTWLDAAQAPQHLHDGITKMLAASPTAQRYGEPAEEWAIHDYEHFGPIRLGEYESIEQVAALARGITAHGDAFVWWWMTTEASGSNDTELTEAFEDAYLGHYDSAETYGLQLLEDLGFDPDRLPGIPDSLRPYLRLDAEAWVRDMQYAGELITAPAEDGGVFLFSIR